MLYWVLAGLFALCSVASVGGHATTFYLFGFGLLISFILGLGITGLVLAVGFQAFEKIFRRNVLLQTVVVALPLVLCGWGLLQMAEARGLMVSRSETSTSTASYVDNTAADDAPAPSEGQDSSSSESSVRNTLGNGMVNVMLSADLALGMTLSLLLGIRSDEDFSAWQKMNKASKMFSRLQKQCDQLLSLIKVSKAHCMAGIQRAKGSHRRRTIPYHRALACAVAAVLLVGHASAQKVDRQEGYLLDESGSIGKGGADNELFREYLKGVQHLLLTEPPNSRVWVSVITTESFGSVRSLVKGWTPESQGVFTDNLNRARRQLAQSFEAKSAQASPSAGGTDIIGALWQIHTMFESGALAASKVSNTIWIFSDMMNESAQFLMPALLPAGATAMLQRAKAQKLIVPLPGYQVHVVGASTSGLSPQQWNTVKQFWTEYFREAGANLVTYAAETDVGQDR